MKSKFIQYVAVTFISLLLLTACGGGGAKVSNTTTNTTMGQELMDLNASYKQGLLTEKEYNQAKKDIMERYKR